MKRLFIYIMLLMGVILPSAAKNRAKQVIAHRGYWKTEGSAQNSISSLQNTYKIGVYGSEFDVHITRDGEVVVFHDDDVEGIKIENANYADIKDKRLKNGEKIVQHAPKSKVSYLNGDLSPREAKEAGYAGIDYEDSVYIDHPSWIKEARQLGLVTNVWTVNDLKEIKYFFRQGIDYVTTNEPEKAKAL